MDPTSKLVARKMFKLRVHEAKGFAFQRLFELVMGYRYTDFVPVRPYGNAGDRKNDGYIPSEGRYFQVFAPENPASRNTEVSAAQKAVDDFEGLKAFWDKSTPIRDFRFVFNDEYRGSPPPLEKALSKIRGEHKIEAGVFLAKDLEAEALSLAQDQLMDVIGTTIPDIGLLHDVSFGVLREVINHVLEQQVPLKPEAALRAPDFTDKINFNGLTSVVAALLTVGSYQNDAVKDYFSKNSTFARQEVRDRLNSMYITSRQKFSSLSAATAEIGDLTFFDLLEQVTPPTKKLPRMQKAVQEAAIVVMAYYFEACDIFEDPNAAP
jgi:hypothetical protein